MTALRPHQTVTLPPEVARHVQVLRLRDESAMVLFDGSGGEYPATLHFEGGKAQARVGEHSNREAELAQAVCLVQGLPSGDKMDWIIEKAVELGVSRIVPVAAERSVLRLSGPRLEKRLAHWRAVAQSASEQCGRNRIAEISAPVTLAQHLAQASQGVLRLLCQPEAPTTLAQALNGPDQALELLVGPEGGWSEAELAQARRQQVTGIRFGARVLRTETAGPALLAACAALRGWD